MEAVNQNYQAMTHMSLLSDGQLYRKEKYEVACDANVQYAAGLVFARSQRFTSNQTSTISILS